MHTHRGGAGRMRFVFIYFPLKHEKRRNSPQRAQRFDICSPVSVNRLGEDDVCMCVCLHVCTHVFVLIWVLHVHVNLSSCGVSYFWQEIVGGEVCVFVCVCVCVFTFSCWGLWMFLVVVQAGRQAGREPCGAPRAALFPCFPPAVCCCAGWWPGWLPAELAALLFL